MAQTDHEVGRVLDRVKSLGQEENTLVLLVIGDNGASAEGSLQGLFNEVTFLNGIPEDLATLSKRMDELGSASR